MSSKADSIFMFGSVYNYVLALYLLPPFSLFLKVMGVQGPVIFFSYTIMMLILIVSIVKNLVLHGFSSKQLIAMSASGVAIIIIFFIEVIHVVTTGRTIDQLNDIRLLLYSPLYGEMLIFNLYAIYLGIQPEKLRLSALRFIIRFVSLSSFLIIIVIQAGKWGFIHLNMNNEIISSNSTAYMCLTVLTVILFFRDKIDLGLFESKVAALMLLAVMALVMSKGAILLCILISLLFLLRSLNHKPKLALMFALFILITTCMLLFSREFKDTLELFINTFTSFFNLLYFAHDIGWTSIQLSEETDIVYETPVNMLSALSRTGTIFISGLLFSENLFFGIGQAASYEINVVGSGIHSFFFLLLLATGMVGLAAFLCSLIAIFFAYPQIEISFRTFLLFILFASILVLSINSIPLYFAIIFGLVANCGDKSEYS